MKRLLRQILPPAIWNGLARARSVSRGGIGFSGNYASWDEALRASRGYDSPLILEKAKTAMLKVRRGEAVFERDTVLFEEIEYYFPLLAGLLYAASRNGNRLRVLDFGGSLGSSYIQNRGFLQHLAPLRWHVVEQRHVVAAGQEHFENDHLRFFETIEAASAEGPPDIVVLLSVLQYLPDPLQLLERVKQLGPRFLLVDRTPMYDAHPKRLTVQSVPPSIYDASYPCWIFNREELFASVAPAYTQRFHFPSHAGTVIDLGDAVATYGGAFFERTER